MKKFLIRDSYEQVAFFRMVSFGSSLNLINRKRFVFEMHTLDSQPTVLLRELLSSLHETLSRTLEI